jgi:hypothetical protein
VNTVIANSAGQTRRGRAALNRASLNDLAASIVRLVRDHPKVKRVAEVAFSHPLFESLSQQFYARLPDQLS